MSAPILQSSPFGQQKRGREEEEESPAKRAKALGGDGFTATAHFDFGANAVAAAGIDGDDSMMCDDGGDAQMGGQHSEWANAAPRMQHQLSTSSLSSFSSTNGPPTPSDSTFPSFPNPPSSSFQTQAFTDLSGVTRHFPIQPQHQQPLQAYPTTLEHGFFSAPVPTEEVNKKKDGSGFGSESYALSHLGWGWRKEVRN
ncbi:hypothetical protein P7C70_g5217, partial [Phenoliferia sp. Uapishka_3]